MFRGIKQFDIDDRAEVEREIINFKQFIENEGIQIIVGINVYRIGPVMSRLSE
jgi:hypothetical protein